MEMYQCSKKVVTYKEHSCSDHSDFPGHSMFTSDVCWDSWVLVFSGTQVQPQIILDPDYLPDYLSVSYDYGLNKTFLVRVRETLTSVTSFERKKM